MHLDWGAYYLSIDTQGNAEFVKTRGNDEETLKFTATKEELLEVYNTANNSGFFSLNNDYTDPSIMDGGWNKISITANGTTKSVRMNNYSADEFDAVENKINEIITNHLGLNAYDISDIGTDSVDFTPEYCGKAENSKACVDYCSSQFCSEKLCDAMVFDAEGCTECGPGCCSYCSNLDSCYLTDGCTIAWVHPSGESWEFGGCENTNFCGTVEDICNYISVSEQGSANTAALEEDNVKKAEYHTVAEEFEKLFAEECR